MFEKSLKTAVVAIKVATAAVALVYTVKWYKGIDEFIFGNKNKTKKNSKKRDHDKELVIEFID